MTDDGFVVSKLLGGAFSKTNASWLSSVNTESKSLTVGDLRRAIQQIQEQDQDATYRIAHRQTVFWETIPEAMRKHPFVLLVGETVGSAVMHPQDAKAIEDELERLRTLSPEELEADSQHTWEQLRKSM